MNTATSATNNAAAALGETRAGVTADHSWIWKLVAVSTALKLVLALLVRGHAPVLDEVAYLSLARGLAENGAFEGTFRPPMYPAFMAAFLALGAGTFGIRIAQVVISALSVILVYRIGTSAFGARAGRIAAVIFAFDPVLIAFTHRLWSETLFVFLLLLLIERLLQAIRSGSAMPWAAAGVALGLAGLTRPMILTFAPLLLPWALWYHQLKSWRTLVARFAIMTAVCCALVLPWTARNYFVSGSFILVDTNGAFNFLVGTQPEAAFVDKDDVWSERFGRVAGERYEEFVLREPARAQDLALTAARRNLAEAPGRFIRKAVWEAGHLWTLDSFLLRHLRNGWYGPEARRWLLPVITPMAAAFSAFLVLSGLLGLATAKASALRTLGLLLIGHATLLFGFTYALSRYALPLHVVLAFFAGVALADLQAARRQLLSGPHRIRRTVVATIALLLIGSAWLRDVPLLANMITDRGAAYRFRYERYEPPAEPATAELRATNASLR